MGTRLLLTFATLAFAAGEGIDFGTLATCSASDKNPVFCDGSKSTAAFLFPTCTKAIINSHCGGDWDQLLRKHCSGEGTIRSYRSLSVSPCCCYCYCCCCLLACCC